MEGNSAIRKMFESGQELAASFGRENVYDFSLGNPMAPVPYEVKNAVISILENQEPQDVHGYMKNAGYDEVREKVAENLNRRFLMSYDKEDIIMTNGAAGGLNVVLRTLLNPGDEVIAFAPFFTEYRAYAENYGGKLSVVPPDTESFQLNLSALPKLLGRRTRAVIINNPNNPSGALYPREQLERLGALLQEAEERYERPIYLICDEPYRELVYDGGVVPYVPGFLRNSIYLYSFSKTLSIPGERIGYLALRKEVDGYEELMPALVIANRCLGFVNAPSLFQRAIAECLDVRTTLDFYDKNRRLLYAELLSLGFDCAKPEGAFYLLVRAPGGDAQAFARAAEEQRIIVVPTDGFGLPGYVRIAYCVPGKVIERSLPAFSALAAALGISGAR